MRPPSSLALAACTACTVPNPAFDIDATAGTAATTSPTTASPTTTSTAEPTATTLAPTSTTSTPTTGPVEPGTTTDTTGTSSDTDGGASTGDSDGDPRSCWPQQHDGWPLAGAELLQDLHRVRLVVRQVEPGDLAGPHDLGIQYVDARDLDRPVRRLANAGEQLGPHGRGQLVGERRVDQAGADAVDGDREAQIGRAHV